MIRLLDAFLMLHGRRALAWVGGFRRRHPIGYVAYQLPIYPVWHKGWPNRIVAHETEGWT